MSKLSPYPQNVSKTVWYYESPKSLEFIVECRTEGNYHQTLRFRVQSRKLIASLKRQGLIRKGN